MLENWENCLGYLVGLCIKITEVLSIHSWVCLSYFSPVLVGTQLSFKWVAKTAFRLFFLNEEKPEVAILVVFVWIFTGNVAWSECLENWGPFLNGGGRTMVREDTEKAKLPSTFLCISLHWQDQSSTISDPRDWVKRSIGRLSLGQGRIGLKNTYKNLACTWIGPGGMHPQVLWELMDTSVRLLTIISGDRRGALGRKQMSLQ